MIYEDVSGNLQSKYRPSIQLQQQQYKPQIALRKSVGYIVSDRFAECRFAKGLSPKVFLRVLHRTVQSK